MKTISELAALGLAVRLHRQKAGLSQERLADLASLHRTYIGGIERGERNVGYLNLVAIAKALEVPLADLVRTAAEI